MSIPKFAKSREQRVRPNDINYSNALRKKEHKSSVSLERLFLHCLD